MNGQILGTCNPYVPQEFEFTHVASDGNNGVDVLISDLMLLSSGAAKPQLTFAVHSGFEQYGGIIRDVWVEIRPATFIENLSLAYEFKNNFSRDCTNEKANAFVARKPKTVEETVVQIRKPCHAYILSLMQVASGEKSP